MKNHKKSENGITLIMLTVYIMAIFIVIGTLSAVSNFFYGNIFVLKDSARYAAEFDRFNSSILCDAKANKHVVVNESEKTIIFEDGTTYKYNEDDNGVYRGKNKIASNVMDFKVSKKTIVIENVDKDILTINIKIGTSDQNVMNKKIDYTLKYW